MENPKKSMSVTEPRPKLRPTSSQSKMPLMGASIPTVGETSRYVGQNYEDARERSKKQYEPNPFEKISLPGADQTPPDPNPKIRASSSQSTMPHTGASIPELGQKGPHERQILEEKRDFRAVHGNPTKKDYPKDSNDILFMKCDKYPKEVPPLLKHDPKPGDHPENISISDLLPDDTEYQALARMGGGRKNLLSQEYLDMLESLRREAQEELQRRKEKGQAGVNPDKKDRPFPFRTQETSGWYKRGRVPHQLRPLPGVNDNRFKEVTSPAPGHATAERKEICNRSRYGPAPYDSDNLSVWKRGVEEIKQKRSLDDRFKGRR